MKIVFECSSIIGFPRTTILVHQYTLSGELWTHRPPGQLPADICPPHFPKSGGDAWPRGLHGFKLSQQRSPADLTFEADSLSPAAPRRFLLARVIPVLSDRSSVCHRTPVSPSLSPGESLASGSPHPSGVRKGHLLLDFTSLDVKIK